MQDKKSRARFAGMAQEKMHDELAKELEAGDAEKGKSYHGYYFKVLKGHGRAETLRQLDYVIEGAMIRGFALVAVPAQYQLQA